jgi:tetratricopeptide (TPR) repeat protein
VTSIAKFFRVALVVLASSTPPGGAAASPIDRLTAQACRERGLADIDKGNLAEADSLLSVADSAGVLDGLDYLNWMPAKAALAGYAGAGVLCCKAGAVEPGMADVARIRLAELLKDRPVKTRGPALAAYRKCALSRPGCDTLKIKGWLLRVYEYSSMFAEAVDLLRELDTPRFPSARDFTGLARERLALGLVSEAVTPAEEAYHRSRDAEEKALAAAVAYQCYVKMGRNEAAAQWLPRAELSDPRFRAQAAAFLQRAGLLDKADSLIAGLPASLGRDTLMIRQALFTGDLAAAAQRAAALQGDRQARVIWKIRTSVFLGRADSLQGWLDTVTVASSWEYGREALAFRYKLEVLKDSPPDALGDFGAVEYALWLGRPKKAEAVPLSGREPAVRRMLACGIAAELLAQDFVDDAAKVLAQLPASDTTPELSYYRGEILIRQGFPAKGAEVLNRLVLSNPGDVFALRAKRLLLRIGRGPRP